MDFLRPEMDYVQKSKAEKKKIIYGGDRINGESKRVEFSFRSLYITFAFWSTHCLPINDRHFPHQSHKLQITCFQARNDATYGVGP